MLLNSLRAAIFVITLSSISANAAPITEIKNLDIGGTLYNVTFNGSKSFNILFDKDADGIFGEGDGAKFNREPIFWLSSNAELAANAIIQALGDNHITNSRGDSFAVPSGPHDSIDLDYFGYTDFNDSTSIDQPANRTRFSRENAESNFPIATFELSVQTVPTSSTITLAGLALAVMGVMRCRRRVS